MAVGNIVSSNYVSNNGVTTQHDGFSSSTIDSFQNPDYKEQYTSCGTPDYIYTNGDNTAGYGNGFVYRMSDWTPTVDATFDSRAGGGYNPGGLNSFSWDNTRLLSHNGDNQLFVRWDAAFDGSLDQTIANQDDYQQGTCWDGTDLWSGDPSTNLIYHHTTFSTTVTGTFGTEDANVNGMGVANDGDGDLMQGGSADLIYVNDGFTATLSATYTGVNDTNGASDDAWDGEPGAAPVADDPVKPDVPGIIIMFGGKERA